MKTMKKFWKYFLNFVVLVVLVMLLTHWGVSKMKKNDNTIEKTLINNAKIIRNDIESDVNEFTSAENVF